MNIVELDSYNLADAVRFHNRLNPRLWDRTEHLHPQVKDRLMTVARDFAEFLGVPDLDIRDITISGSNAAYNYTENSDIDLHLVVEIPRVKHDEVYRELFNAKKYQYNDEHDIRIGGADVELYAQPSDQPHHSQGIYSLLRNAWVSVPRRHRAKIDDSSVRAKYEDLVHRIDDAVNSDNYERMANLQRKIKTMRQVGLEQQGEFGVDNIVFKLLRVNGFIKKLIDARNRARDRELSLNERRKKKSKKRVRYGFGGYWYPGFGFSDSGEGGGDGGGGESRTMESPDGVSPSTRMFLSEEPVENVVQQFIQGTAQRLGIERLPKVHLHNQADWSEQHHSFGKYEPETNELHVNLHGRHLFDILRTTAHELAHCRQHEIEPLDIDAGDTGSDFENEAHAVAGIIMRDFADAHPGLFAHNTVKESSGYIPTKAEKNDPRFVMALTADVRPGATGLNANRMALKTDSQGRPQLLRANGQVDMVQDLIENKIQLSTDPNWYGAEVGDYKATGPVFNVHPHLLVGFEPDDKMNQPKSKANVEKIVAGLKKGNKLPPLLVRKYKDGYQVLDGHHRFWAYKSLGIKSIPVQVVPAKDIEEINKQTVKESDAARTAKSAIDQTEVFGVRGYRARCLEPGCEWHSRSYDRIKQAQDSAKKHAAAHIKPGVAESIQHKKITELFDAKTSFPLKWDTQFASSGEVHAEAYDADGRTIDISFTPTGYGSGIEIVFKRGGSYDMTGHGDAPRVLATVVNAISQYLQKYQPPYIAFSAKSTGGRAGAYAAMIRRLARGYTLLTPDEYPEDTKGFLDFLGSDTPFILAKDAKMDTQDVAEGKVINTYLWHGSRQKIPMLEPRQAVDTGGAAGSNQNAIYATSDPKVAVAMGLTTPDSDTAMFPNDPQMVLFSGKIRKGEYVYLHKLPFNGPDDKPQFVQGAHDREFYSIPRVKAIKPIEIKEIPVNKYLNLIRKATPADLKLRKKHMKEGVAETQEKFNQAVMQPGFEFSQEINGVTYEVTNDAGHGPVVTVTDKNNEVIAQAAFSKHKTRPGLESINTYVEPAWQGEGIAANMYAVMRMLGANISPSTNQTDDGLAMWAKWNKQGDAKHIKSLNSKIKEQGVAEGSDIPQWRVEQSDATGRYYIVSGYSDKSRRVWKSKLGAIDFVKKADAEAKAHELKQGVAEGAMKDLDIDLQDQQWDAIVGYVVDGLKNNMDIGRMELNLYQYAGQEMFDVDQELENRGFRDLAHLAAHIQQNNGRYVPPRDFDLGEDTTKKDLVESLRQEFELLEDEFIGEIKMSPTNLRSEAAQTGARAGMEFEMIVPGVKSDSDEMEPDYDQDERCRSIDDAVEFFHDGDYNGRREVERLRERMQEDFSQWLFEKIDEDWDRNAEEHIYQYLVNDADASTIGEIIGQDLSDADGATKQQVAQAAEIVNDNEQQPYYDDARDFHREEYQDAWDESDWLDDTDLDTMSAIENAYDITWPHWTYSEGAGVDVDSVANDFSEAVGMPVNASQTYHGGRREAGHYVVEPDGSLRPDSDNDEGLEFVSPPMPIDQMLDQLKKVRDWAGRYGCYTNDSTGLHINVSVPEFSNDRLDYVKLALLLGDQYVLDQFGRSSNTYTKSALSIVQDRVRTNPNTAQAMLDRMRGHMEDLATKAIHSGDTSKYTSINTKQGYIEFRSPGGDWLDENFDKVENTLLRFTVALKAAMDPEAYREEYLKKLYKLLEPTAKDQKGSDTVRYFADYVAGKIPAAALRSFVKQAQLQRRISKEPASGKQYWWRVYKDGRDVRNTAMVEVVASSEQEARDKAAAEFGIFSSEYKAYMDAVALRPYVETETEYEIFQVAGGRVVQTFRAADDNAALAYFDRTISAGDRPYYDVRRAGTGTAQPAAQQPAGGWEFELSQTDIENRLGLPDQTGDANYEVFNRNTQRPVFVFIANTAADASRKYSDWLAASGLPNDTEDYGFRERARPGSTLDIQRRRADQSAKAAVASTRQQPSGGGNFTGVWLILDHDGNVIHSFAGVGNAQSDANRVAMDWLRRNPGAMQAGVTVVPEML